MIRGRYAPSPTGALHLGNARTALLAWLMARSQGGQFVMRMEDLDGPRTVPGAAEGILSDLRWLGLDWDEGPDVGGPFSPYVQSARSRAYDDALASLSAQGLVFECWCSRAEIAAASAPHGPQDDGPRYPGTCRSLSSAATLARRGEGRPPSLRFRVEPGEMRFRDAIFGEQAVDLSAAVGDFVVRRSDGPYAYQLAVAVDDGRMGITDVVRGADLLSSTPRQIRILEALGLPVPRWAHVPLLLGADGQRLSKRNGDRTLSALRSRGIGAPRLVAALARSAGLTDRQELEPRELVGCFELERLSREPATLDLTLD